MARSGGGLSSLNFSDSDSDSEDDWLDLNDDDDDQGIDAIKDQILGLVKKKKKKKKKGKGKAGAKGKRKKNVIDSDSDDDDDAPPPPKKKKSKPKPKAPPEAKGMKKAKALAKIKNFTDFTADRAWLANNPLPPAPPSFNEFMAQPSPKTARARQIAKRNAGRGVRKLTAKKKKPKATKQNRKLTEKELNDRGKTRKTSNTGKEYIAWLPGHRPKKKPAAGAAASKSKPKPELTAKKKKPKATKQNRKLTETELNKRNKTRKTSKTGKEYIAWLPGHRPKKKPKVTIPASKGNRRKQVAQGRIKAGGLPAAKPKTLELWDILKRGDRVHYDGHEGEFNATVLDMEVEDDTRWIVLRGAHPYPHVDYSGVKHTLHYHKTHYIDEEDWEEIKPIGGSWLPYGGQPA